MSFGLFVVWVDELCGLLLNFFKTFPLPSSRLQKYSLLLDGSKGLRVFCNSLLPTSGCLNICTSDLIDLIESLFKSSEIKQN